MTFQIDSLEKDFTTLAASHHAVNWTTERGYILQAMAADWKFSRVTEISLRNAILNIAKTGLSISPLEGLAFLQVRTSNIEPDKHKPENWLSEAVFSTGYKGMIAGLVACGAVNWMRADVVRSGDYFEYRGPAAMPAIKVTDAFGSARAEILGPYALAELPNGQILCEIIRPEEITEIMKASRAKSGPWFSYPAEMQKKSALNRLGKTIPRKPGSRADAILAAALLDDEMDFEASSKPASDQSPEVITKPPPMLTKQDMKKIEKACISSGRNYQQYLDWMANAHTLSDGVLLIEKKSLPSMLAQINKPPRCGNGNTGAAQ